MFVREYLVDLNQGGAARRAGYSARSSRSIGKELMQNPAIRAEVRKALAKRAQRIGVKADDVLRALAEIAQMDKGAVVQVRNGTLHVTDTDLLPPAVRRCISAVSQTQHGIRLQFDDRVKALELLGRHLALFTDNLTVNDSRSKAIDEMTEEEIDAALARLGAEAAPAGQEPGASAE